MIKQCKWWIVLAALGVAIACATMIPNVGLVIEAQTLPYTLTLQWTAPSDGSATAYNCYLDGVQVVTSAPATTCQFPVPTGGPHTVGVTSVNPTFIPPESGPATLAFTLKAPTAPTGLKGH